MSNVTINGTRAKTNGLTLAGLKAGESFAFKGSESRSVYLKVTDERSARQIGEIILDDTVRNNVYVSVATGQIYTANPNSRVVRVRAAMFT